MDRQAIKEGRGAMPAAPRQPTGELISESEMVARRARPLRSAGGTSVRPPTNRALRRMSVVQASTMHRVALASRVRSGSGPGPGGFSFPASLRLFPGGRRVVLKEASSFSVSNQPPAAKRRFRPFVRWLIP